MKIKCPHCGTQYEVGNNEIGKFAECETCGKGFVVGTTSPSGGAEDGSVDEILGIPQDAEQKLEEQAKAARQIREEQERLQREQEEQMFRAYKTKAEREKQEHQRARQEQASKVQRVSVNGLALSVFLAVLLANVLFAALSFMVVGNQMGKISEKLGKISEKMDKLSERLPKAPLSSIEYAVSNGNAISVVIEGTRHTDGNIYLPKR